MSHRDYKFFRPSCYYHIFNRGVNKENIFRDENDFFNFLKRLKLVLGLIKSDNLHIKALPEDAFTILSYCLMPNHFHFLIRQNTELTLDKLFSKLTTSYCMYFNKKYGRVGPLFQDTFKAKLVDSDSYLKGVSAYIHKNPQDPLNYPYSNFLDAVGLRDGVIADKQKLLGLFENNAETYKNFVLSFGTKEKVKVSHLLFEDEQQEKG